MEDPESSLRTDGPPSPVNYEKSLMDRWTLYEAFCPSLQVVPPVFVGEIILLAVARKLTASREILLWSYGNYGKGNFLPLQLVIF